MAIDWSILGSVQPQQNKPIPLPGGGSDSGLGDLFSGLSSLVGSLKPQTQQFSPGFSGSGTGQNIMQGIFGQQPQHGLQGQLQQNTSLGQGQSSIFDTANKELGLHAGDSGLTSFLQQSNPGLDPTKTPWCAGFVGSVLNASGAKGTGSLAAKSYLNWGQPTTAPNKGDIAVFNDLTGNNDPNHGHVGFIQSVDQQNGTVTVLGGNQGGGVSVQTYPMNKVAGFRSAPSGQEIQQRSLQSGIQNPQQLSNVPKQINSSQMSAGPTQNSQLAQQPLNPQAQQTTFNTIKNFEGLDTKAKYDVNAYRAGYGSDTITKADGTIQKVNANTVVTQEDADRDLQRRTQEFAGTASKQVGQNWSTFNPQTQAALTSVAYNYGSLPKSVVKAAQTGDKEQLARAVESLPSNKDRRKQEANMIRNGLSFQDPWQTNNVPSGTKPQQNPAPYTPSYPKARLAFNGNPGRGMNTPGGPLEANQSDMPIIDEKTPTDRMPNAGINNPNLSGWPDPKFAGQQAQNTIQPGKINWHILNNFLNKTA